MARAHDAPAGVGVAQARRRGPRAHHRLLPRHRHLRSRHRRGVGGAAALRPGQRRAAPQAGLLSWRLPRRARAARSPGARAGVRGRPRRPRWAAARTSSGPGACGAGGRGAGKLEKNVLRTAASSGVCAAAGARESGVQTQLGCAGCCAGASLGAGPTPSWGCPGRRTSISTCPDAPSIRSSASRKAAHATQFAPPAGMMIELRPRGLPRRNSVTASASTGVPAGRIRAGTPHQVHSSRPSSAPSSRGRRARARVCAAGQAPAHQPAATGAQRRARRRPDVKIRKVTKLPHPAPLSEIRRKRPRGFSPSSKKKTLASMGNSLPTSCLRRPARSGVARGPAAPGAAPGAASQHARTRSHWCRPRSS